MLMDCPASRASEAKEKSKLDQNLHNLYGHQHQPHHTRLVFVCLLSCDNSNKFFHFCKCFAIK